MVGCLLCTFPISIYAQGKEERWKRVYTGEDAVIDLDGSSLLLDAGHILRVRVRTILSKPEALREEPGTKYTNRLETVEFSLSEKRYRFHDIRLLDSAGKTVQSYEPKTPEDWRTLKDRGMMQRLLHAASLLPPFGEWKVIDYRLEAGTPIDTQEFTSLVGLRVRLYADRAEVGTKVCSMPAYRSRLVTGKDFSKELGLTMESIGIKADHADTIVVKCETSGWEPPQSLLIQLPEGGMLMLWEGVLLVLKQQRVGEDRPWQPTLPQLKRRGE